MSGMLDITRLSGTIWEKIVFLQGYIGSPRMRTEPAR